MIIEFSRPNEEQRSAVLAAPLIEIGFTSANIKDLVKLTGSKGKNKPGFTYSDLTQRLLPMLVLDAYPEGEIKFKRALEITKTMKPTPQFKD